MHKKSPEAGDFFARITPGKRFTNHAAFPIISELQINFIVQRELYVRCTVINSVKIRGVGVHGNDN
jgi:hypothetical protein